MEPEYKGFDVFTGVPSISFLNEHPPTGRKFLFDLGIRKDPENLPPRLMRIMEKGGWGFTAEKNVVGILGEGGDPKDINGIIWSSHYYWDHAGDPSTFLPSTDLIVGPGFKDALLPGYPTNPKAQLLESAYEGQHLREISFAASGLMLGRCNAVDFFGDGSF
ncbi:hypothetical protein OEA41_002724 [Lepraria neglecta]|uniref:Metallo-beta-lactamase domain-containing protein n=1 Tax=Lepraria neglecta TaxID=209136 RepID=A0AAD9Z4U1_9LECA|nr:hypothetical protein OEA41_002724 [Lepraria neglecta]